MKKSLLTIVSLFLTLTLWAQAKIEFEKSLHDFGSFPEAQATAECIFKFKNTGNVPLLIVKAKATCGCTVPEYSKAPIAPGASGEIRVTYSAVGRPGAFNKSIKITTNATPADYSLTIKGNVIGEPDRSEYKYYINGLYLKTISPDMGKITKGAKKSISLDSWNGTDRMLTITVSNVADYMQVKALPNILKPGEKGKIEITYDSKLSNNWGTQVDEFLITSERPNSRTTNKKITVNSFIAEDFSKQGSKVPVVQFEKVLVNFGEIAGINVAQQTITLSNKGKGTLIVRNISSSSPVVSAKIAKNEIKTGGNSALAITINPVKSKSRIVNEIITIVTNDPKNPEIKVQVTATLK